MRHEQITQSVRMVTELQLLDALFQSSWSPIDAFYAHGSNDDVAGLKICACSAMHASQRPLKMRCSCMPYVVAQLALHRKRAFGSDAQSNDHWREYAYRTQIMVI